MYMYRWYCEICEAQGRRWGRYNVIQIVKHFQGHETILLLKKIYFYINKYHKLVFNVIYHRSKCELKKITISRDTFFPPKIKPQNFL